MAKLDTLCDSCRSLNIVTLRAPGGVHHANTFAVLVDRAATCRLCRLIASNDRGELPSSTDRIMSSSVVRCYMTDNVSAPGLFTSVTAEIKQGNGTLYRHLKLFTQPS